MALEEFWRNVRTASRLIAPPAVVADSPRISAEMIAKRLGAADVWLAPAAMRGYDEGDLLFLTADERQRLSEAVSHFLSVAKKVNPRGPASIELAEEARPAFQQIVGLLEFDRYGDAEAFKLGKSIEHKLATYGIGLPQLDHLRFRTGLDNTGDPALWVWAFIKESAHHDEATFFAAVDEIDPYLFPVAREVAQERWPYISYRSTLDQPAIEAVA